MARDRTLVETLLYLHQQLVKTADRLELMTMSQYHLLHFLSESSRRASDFAEVTKLRKPGIASMISTLEKRGWIKREMDPKDARAQVISMTKVGRKAFIDFENAMDNSLREFLGDEAIDLANDDLKEFHLLWNQKRVARFEAWKHKRRKEAVSKFKNTKI